MCIAVDVQSRSQSGLTDMSTCSKITKLNSKPFYLGVKLERGYAFFPLVVSYSFRLYGVITFNENYIGSFYFVLLVHALGFKTSVITCNLNTIQSLTGWLSQPYDDENMAVQGNGLLVPCIIYTILNPFQIVILFPSSVTALSLAFGICGKMFRYVLVISSPNTFWTLRSSLEMCLSMTILKPSASLSLSSPSMFFLHTLF